MSNWGNPYQPATPNPQAPPPQPEPYGVAPVRAFREAELDAMHRSAAKQALLIRWVLAIVLPVFILLRTAGEGLAGVGGGVAIVLVVIASSWVGAMFSRRFTGQRHDAVVAARPGLDVIEVWGARGLQGALKAAGVATPKMRRGGATSLSMVLSTEGLELWSGRGSTVAALVAVPWSAVAAIDETRGSITNDGTRPAFMLVTAIGQRLVFVPRTRTNGGRVARVPELRALVARLDALRVGALAR
ncbi:hypothetical protein ACPPVS_00320 [Cellulomonas sp. McL0617]|uniref:hypothetical protein n=1 Tax=Cellulomonas sp. McL0617 TaxID=3415675 RepID=UPI003CEAF201